MNAEYETAIAYARDLGAQHGHAAATWYHIHTEDDARSVLAGIEDCDPVVMDSIPLPDLSGEWADRITGPQLVRDAWDSAGVDSRGAEGDSFSDICDAYEDAFRTAAEDEIVRAARYMLAD